MEKIGGYRHFVEPKAKELFVKAIKNSIKKINKKKFGFIGIIGSLAAEESHDIDILIFPGIKTKIGESLIELVKLYDLTEEYLKKHHERYYLAAAPKKSMQEMTYYLAALQEGGPGLIPIHSLFFTNYRDFKRFNPKDFQKVIEKETLTLHGSFDMIKKLPKHTPKELEPYFFILEFEMISRIKTFPKHLVRASAESLFEYLKKRYGIEVKKTPHTIPEIEKEFKTLMKTLDERTYK